MEPSSPPSSSPSSPPSSPQSLQQDGAAVVEPSRDLGQADEAEAFQHSFVLQCDAAVWSKVEPLTELLDEMDRFVRTHQVAHPASSSSHQAVDESWLSTWRPLLTRQHGKLHPQSFVTDPQSGASWLIDLGSSGLNGPFEDAARMIVTLLTDLYPMPPSFEATRTTSAAQLAEVLSLEAEGAELLRTRLAVSLDPGRPCCP